MFYEVYLDVLFVLNGMMDFFLLRLVNRMLHTRASPINSLVGAIFGAGMFCLLLFIPLGPRVNTLLSYVIIDAVMVRIGCKVRKILDLLKGILFLYGGAFLLGGVMQNLLRWEKEKGVLAFWFIATVSYLCTMGGIRIYERSEKMKGSRATAWLYTNGRCKEVKALLDTGNQLYDPINRKAVCVGSMQLLETLFDEKTRKQLENFWDGKESGKEFGTLHPHFIPFTSLGCTQGLALAVTLDYLYIEGAKVQKVISRPVIAFSRENSSFCGDCQLILHPNLIKS